MLEKFSVLTGQQFYTLMYTASKASKTRTTFSPSPTDQTVCLFASRASTKYGPDYCCFELGIPLNLTHSLTEYFCNFDRDADDTQAWIIEKDVALSSTDYGRDLASVQALQRKHEALERDLAALEEKVC